MAESEATTWPRPYETIRGPYPEVKVAGVIAGMGEHAPTLTRLLESGTLSPDLMTQFTLFLVARQPRVPRPAGAPKKKGAPGVAGKVWARERVTYHRPVAVDDAFSIEGADTGRHVRKHRRYATTTSATFDASGRRVATNATTGLLSYRPDPSLVDGVEGVSGDLLEVAGADWKAAASNPHLDALSTADVGEVLGGKPMVMSLAMMAARDTDNPDNPIHSDPELARKAGLARPIAGGSHVHCFALEAISARFGSESLLWGAHVDTRWKAPVECDVEMTPVARVTRVEPDRVDLDFEIRLSDERVACAGQVTIPRPV